MSPSSDDIYKEIISLQSMMWENHNRVCKSIEDLKDSVAHKISPLEEKVAKHQHTFEMTSRILTWLVPSGFVISLCSWLSVIFQHK